MGRSYLGCPENISTGQIILFCFSGEMFSRLPGKVSRCDVDFVKCKQIVFRKAGKLCSFIKRDRSRYPGKLFVPYERNVTFHIIS